MSFGFRLSTLRHHWSLLPLLGFTGLAVGMCGSYVSYMALTKPDLSYSPWSYSTKPPYKDIAPTEVRKFMNMHKGKIVSHPEIEQLRREIYSYKSQ